MKADRTEYNYGITAARNRVRNSQVYVTTLPMAIPDVEISAARFLLCFVAKRYILQQECLKKLIGSCLLETRRYNFQRPTLTLSAPQYTVLQTNRQADRRQHHVKSRSYYVQQYGDAIA